MMEPGKHVPMLINDAASMMRRKIKPNMPPYIQSILKYNNNLVDNWKKEVLDKIANGQGKIPAQHVYDEWLYYSTGCVIKEFIKNYDDGLLPRPTQEMVEKWKQTFSEVSVDDLIKMGPGLVSQAWKILMDENYIAKMYERYEKVYMKTDDPLEWRELCLDYPKLWNNDSSCVFWDQETYGEISEKVICVLKYGDVKPE